MRSVDAATIAALQNPDGIVERDLITIFARTFEGEDVTFCFWSDSGDVSALVYNADGVAEARDFIGSGTLLSAGEVTLTQNLDVRQMPVELSQLHPDVQNMVRGHELRGAGIEVHRMLLDVDTRLAVGVAYLHFIGEVDRAPIGTPAAGEEGAITLHCVSDTRQLTRVNHTRRGLQASLARSGDRFLTYASQAGQFEVWWGEEPARRPASGSANPTYTGGGGGYFGGGFGGSR